MVRQKGNHYALPDSEVFAEPIPETHQLNPCQKTRATLSAIYTDKVAKPIVMYNAMQQVTWIIQLPVVPIFRIIIRDPIFA